MQQKINQTGLPEQVQVDPVLNPTIEAPVPPVSQEEIGIYQDQVEITNDISKQTKDKEVHYVPREWVAGKLEQVKATHSLQSEVRAIVETLKVTENVISVDIQTKEGQISTMELSFFEGGVFKFKCINPHNPSKFSLELIDKPEGLVPCHVDRSFVNDKTRIEVPLGDAQIIAQMHFNPFNVQIFSTKDGSIDLLFEMNANKSLKFDENISADFTFHTEYLYGLPQRAHDLIIEDTRKDLPYRFYNQDVPGYPIGSKNSLYGAVPVLVSRKPNSSSFVSMYWQNTSDTYIDVHRAESASNTYWMSERGNLECYIFANHCATTHFKGISNVLGHCAMPQYFSLGYHQCRWSYNDQEDLLHVNSKFNEHEIPCDTLTLDIDHTNECRYFTWNYKLFPDPLAMQDILVNDGRQLVTIADPHIKADDDYEVYKVAFDKGLYVKNKDNQPFVGKCWPGDSIYLDYLNEETRNHWASQYSYEKYKFSTPNVWAWNDMNEPSVFEHQGNHMPLDNLQTFKSLSDPDNTFQVEHREVHNIYGYLQHKATYDGMVKRNKCLNFRPHVLSRSFFAGSQKYTALWTGDTGTTWEYLRQTVPQLLSLSICGISNVGGDVGGFIGNPEPELAIRWYQLGAFMPFFRGHSAKNSDRREPWLYDKKTSNAIREAIMQRYRLLPYWYTCFEEHCRTGVPVLKPVWLDQDQVTDKSTLHDQQRFMFGDSLLVVPILEPGKDTIYDPLKGLQGRWYDYYRQIEMLGEQEIKTGMENIGCFVKGGRIVPNFAFNGYVKSSQHARKSDINLCVGLNENSSAQGNMYFDDGETFNYKKGSFQRNEINYQEDTLSWNNAEANGEFSVDNKVTKAFILGANHKYQNAFLFDENNRRQQIQAHRTAGGMLLEFAAKTSKNWKILLK